MTKPVSFRPTAEDTLALAIVRAHYEKELCNKLSTSSLYRMAIQKLAASVKSENRG